MGLRTGRIGSRRRVVDIEAGAIAVPARRDRRPIEGRIAHGLVSIRIANAGFQRMQPAALADVVFHIDGKRGFPAAVILVMSLYERDPVVVRIRQIPWRVIDVGTGQVLDLRDSVGALAVLIVSHRTRGHEDVVVGDPGIDVLGVEIGVEPRNDIPLDVCRDLLRALGVVEIPGFILEVQAVPPARGSGEAIIDEWHAWHGRTGVELLPRQLP
jgi:hypothetical protein